MEKVFITDKQGNKVLPKTHVSAVYDDEGNDLGSHLGAFEDEVRGLVDTPHQEYVTVATYASLPASGSEDTIYRVSNYNGSTSQVDTTSYSEYAWDGSQYIFLCVKSQIDEVFDITVYNNNTKYADLAAALGINGANVPQSLRKGGMSIKFVQSSDNKYVQWRLTSSSFSIDVNDWQGIDDEPTAGSDNLVKSGGVAAKVLKIDRWAENNDGDAGVIIYRSDLKQLRKKTGTASTSYNIIPFLSGAIYTYQGQLYIWDGTMLRPNYVTPIYTEDADINNCIEYMYSDNLPTGCYIYQFSRSNSGAVISIKDSNATTVARLSLDTPPIAGSMYEIPAFTTDGYHAYIVFNENTYSKSGINVPLLSQISAGGFAAIAQIDINKKKQIKENSRYYVKNTQFNPEVFIKGIEPGTADLGVIFSNSNVNNITNFQNWKYIPNDTDIVRTEWQGHQSVGITGTMSDLVSAWFVKAVNNADGDLVLAADEWSPTGGWHGYNGSTQGTPTPTGRTLWCKVYADGKEVAVGNGTFANKVEIQWCNKVQACNTEKADGSGREVIEEIITVIFDEGMKAKVAVEAKALEDILVQHHYGLNTYNSTSATNEINGDVIFVGDNNIYDKNETGVGGKGVTSDDKNCNEILFRGERFSFSLKVDEHSCGNFKYCTQPTGGSGIYGNPSNKGMLRTIDAPADAPIPFSQGSAIIVRGYYDCYMSKFSI